ncbi:alpha/beta hydrolase family protein (plasmid) [Rhizobium gallicum]|uniref:Alpha/beta hydrolase family protein n=1 Tax=Rhizobium gallicum TaxID=56730 RepID=A0A1L5NWK6_9HYPH|nr:alpha/beta hydrolase family protein [Rhizobium gallicum]
MVEPISQEQFSALKRNAVLSNGLRLAYVEMGDPDGVPILLLHGFTDSARSWSLAAPYLATGFRVVAPDLRGHGHSDKPEGCYTIPEMATDVRFLIETLGLVPTHVVGHSLGGRLAQAVAERWPRLVRKIVLLSTSAALRERRGWLWETIQMLRDPIDPECGNGVLENLRSTRIFLPMLDAKAPRCRHASGIRFITSSLPMTRRHFSRIFPRRPSSCEVRRISSRLRNIRPRCLKRSPARSSFLFPATAITSTGKTLKGWPA